MVHAGNPTVAVYYMHWTVGHLNDPGANLDLVLGHWGDHTSAEDRVLVSLIHRQRPEGRPELMVVDAAVRLSRVSNVAQTALARSDVIGTPLASQVFGIVDAIYLQDTRFF